MNNAALTVSGSGSLIIRSGKGASSYCIYAQGVTIKDTAEVSITAGCADASAPGVCYSCGIFSGWEACSIYGGANVTAVGGTTESENATSIGIHAWRAMAIDDSNVTAKGNTRAMNIAPTIMNGTISAATDVLGNDAAAYAAANIAQYKYIRVTPGAILQPSYTVTYDANGATSGSAPPDTNSYGSGDTVTVAANSGNLQKTCHTFAGWNTKADGTGISYAAGSGTFSISDNTVLYAKWAEAHSSSPDWLSDKDATATESGSKHEECKICGFKKACVEILPVGPSAPQTGDNNHVESSLAVMLLALGGIAAAITIGRKKSRMAK